MDNATRVINGSWGQAWLDGDLVGECYGMNGYAWCAMFVSWCADRAGISTDIIPKYHSSTEGMNWFKSHGRWKPRGGADPQPGDVIFFSDSGIARHTGIVTDVKDGRVYTVEGNTSGGSDYIANGGGVAAKSYPLTYSYILGYGHPEYKEDDITKDEVLDIIKEYEAQKAAADPSSWSEDARTWATETSKQLAEDGEAFLKGDGAGNMKYKSPCTREMVAVFFFRFWQMVKRYIDSRPV